MYVGNTAYTTQEKYARLLMRCWCVTSLSTLFSKLQSYGAYLPISGMMPYPEPFQSMYQKRRLGTLGIEWRPPSVNFAVGPMYNATTGEYQTIPIIDPDRWEPLPEITDFIELEPENEVISDDTDSEYNGMDENPSEGEQEIMSGDSSGTSYSSAEIDADNPNSAAHLRRSRRKKKKSEVRVNFQDHPMFRCTMF